MLVVDASAVIEVLLNAELAGRVRECLFGGGESLHAPHLLDLEIAQVLRRYERAWEIRSDRAREALDWLAALPITRYSHHLFLSRIWELRHNVTAYDAAYLALAEALAASLVTCDRGLAASAGHAAEVEFIG